MYWWGFLIGFSLISAYHLYSKFFALLPHQLSTSEKQKITESCKKNSMPLPGDSVQVFQRRGPTPQVKDRELTVISWNIERGYHLEGIISELKRINADIVLLQEVDWGCERTSTRHVLFEIARALDYNAVYSTEFIEVHSPLRPASLQGGGPHGNAILSRFPIKNFKSELHHACFDWEAKGAGLRQPRLGGRVYLKAEIEISNDHSVQCYSCHFENFSGPSGRVLQFSEVVEDARKSNLPTIIGGDFNTEMHGTARLFSIFCDPELRWKTIGKSEASLWQEYLFNQKVHPNLPLSWKKNVSNFAFDDFRDPFDKENDVTSVRAYGIYQAKLDWILTQNPILDFKVEDDKHFSDHQLFWVKVQL